MDTDISELMNKDAFSGLYDTLIGLSMNLLAAVAILIIGLWVAKAISKAVKKTMGKSKLDPSLIGFLSKLVHAGVAAFVIIAALSRIGIQTASFVAVLASAGLAIGLALQGSLSNFAAGVLILVFKPFKPGDWIEAAGVSGSVKEISIFTTILASGDNKKVIVPNGDMIGGSITNYSAFDTRRVDLMIGVSYDADLKKTKEVIENTIKSHELVLKDKDTTVAVKTLNSSSVDFVVRAWVKSGDYWPTYFQLTEEIKNQLDANNITIPFPQMDVHLSPELEAALSTRQAPVARTETTPA